MEHRYLFEQVQFHGSESYTASLTSKKFNLDFNHPVKAMYWVSRLTRHTRDNDLFNFSDTMDPNATKDDPISEAVININGNERFEQRKNKVFRIWEPLKHHTRVPNDFIYMYSFSLNPESHQPSGTLNFSRIDNKDLTIQFATGINAGEVLIYALNYNVLQIKSGMAGVAYAN